MGLLVYCTTLQEAEQVLKAIFIVTISPFYDQFIDSNEYTPCHKSREFLRRQIIGSNKFLFSTESNEKQTEKENFFDIDTYNKDIEEFICSKSFKD